MQILKLDLFQKPIYEIITRLQNLIFTYEIQLSTKNFQARQLSILFVLDLIYFHFHVNTNEMDGAKLQPAQIQWVLLFNRAKFKPTQTAHSNA